MSNLTNKYCILCEKKGVCKLKIGDNADCEEFKFNDEIKQKLTNGHKLYKKKWITIERIVAVTAILIFLYNVIFGIFDRENRLFDSKEQKQEVITNSRLAKENREQIEKYRSEFGILMDYTEENNLNLRNLIRKNNMEWEEINHVKREEK